MNPLIRWARWKGIGWGLVTPKVLVVCTGNTCRSPMAAMILYNQYRTKVMSAGTAAHPKDHAADHAITLGHRQYGSAFCDVHEATNLRNVKLEVFDVVLAMEPQHARAVKAAEFPAERVYTLMVPDPFGGPYELYVKTAGYIESRLTQLPWLAKHRR